MLSMNRIENYFIDWCAEIGIGEEILFNKAFFPSYKILTDFMNSAKIENYDRINFVMTVAERYRAVRRFIFEELNFNGIDKALYEGNLVLVKIKKTVVRNTVSSDSLLVNQFIRLIDKIEDGYTYLNNSTLSKGKFAAAELNEICYDSILIYCALDRQEYRMDLIQKDAEQQLDRIVRAKDNIFEFPKDLNNFTALRDAIGIIKITRRRLKEWFKTAINLGYHIVTQELMWFMDSYIAKVEHIYFLLATAILRNHFNAEKIHVAISGIIAKEVKLSNLIMNGPRFVRPGILMERIRKCINDICPFKECLDENARLIEDIGIDALKLASVVVGIENEFGITFDDGDLDPSRLTTIKELVHLVVKYA